MSSPIKIEPRGTQAYTAEKLAHLARRRAVVSQYFGVGVSLIGLAVAFAFLAQSGFFRTFLPKPAPLPQTSVSPPVVSGTQSNIRGIDKDNLPYEISAQKGVQDQSSATLVHLETVTGVFHRPENKQVNLSSNTALFDSSTKAMALHGDVVFEEPGRYKARMQNASVNLDDKSLVSQSPVTVVIAAGTVEADSLEIIENGKRALFKGHVKARFAKEVQGGGN
jgi:lipopolysaccharide export system protein LptC